MAQSNDNNETKHSGKKASLLSRMNVFNREVNQLQSQPSTYDTTYKAPSGSFSQLEFNSLHNKHRGKIGIEEIRGILAKTSMEISARIASAESFKQMNTELGKAKEILVSSILSPNDLYEKLIPITVEAEGFSAQANAELTKLVSDYFNDELNLVNRVDTWIGEALFETGASPVLLIPKSFIRVVNAASLAENGAVITKAGTIDAKNVNKRFFTLEKINAKLPDKEYDFSLENHQVPNSFRSHISNEAFISEIKTELELNFMGIEALKNEFANNHSVSPIVESVNKLLFNQTAHGLESKVGVSCDYRQIISPSKTASKKARSISDIVDKTIYKTSSLNKFAVLHNDEDVQEGDHPSIMQLPTESVIPVVIPGDRTQHVGYFVLLDGNGNPLTTEEIRESCGQSCISSSIIHSGGQTLAFGSSSLGQQQKYEAASVVFDVTVRKMLQDKLGEYNIKDVSVLQHRAISNTLFQRVLKGQMVRTVFVPADMMMYLAFDYHKDGTGKNIIEDSAFILSMRTTLLVANIMAALKNAMDNKVISFNVGDDASNLEQIMSFIHEAYVEKKMPNFGQDPVTTARDIVSRSISIRPSGVPGMKDLTITSESNGESTKKPDSDIMEYLTKRVVDITGVPYAALNAVSENEYAKSVVTNNLFFSNKILKQQAIVENKVTGLIRKYISLSYPLMEKVMAIIEKTEITKDEQGVNTKEATTALERFISGITINLPPPSVAADKGQYEDLKAKSDAIDTLLDKLIPDDLAVSDTPTPQDVTKVIKAFIKMQMVGQAIGNSGLGNIITIPNMDDLDINGIIEHNQVFKNLSVALTKSRTVTNATADGSSTSTDTGATDANTDTGSTGDNTADTGTDTSSTTEDKPAADAPSNDIPTPNF